MSRIPSLSITLIFVALACIVPLGAMKKTPKNVIVYIDSFAKTAGNQEVDCRVLQNYLHESWTIDDQMMAEYKLAPLHWAVAMGRTNAVEFLLKVSGSKAYDYACIQDDEGWTALHWAVRWGHLEMTKLILATACSYDEAHKLLTMPNKHGKTASDFAHENNNMKVIKAIHKALMPCMVRVGKAASIDQNVEAISEHGMTPLHSAVCSGNALRVAYLIEQTEFSEGKDTYQIISAQDDDGCTPLHWAAYLGHTDIVECLERVAWPESDEFTRIQSKNGWTALHMALQGANSKNKAEIVRLILANIGDQYSFIHLPNLDGESAWDFAVENGNQEIIDMLAYVLSGKNIINEKKSFGWW